MLKSNMRVVAAREKENMSGPALVQMSKHLTIRKSQLFSFFLLPMPVGE